MVSRKWRRRIERVTVPRPDVPIRVFQFRSEQRNGPTLEKCDPPNTKDTNARTQEHTQKCAHIKVCSHGRAETLRADLHTVRAPTCGFVHSHSVTASPGQDLSHQHHK